MSKCLTPHVKDDMSFPCGRCYECKMRRVSGWSFRLIKEGQRSSAALFVTFTYNTTDVPITPRGFMTLHLPHIQRFMKRLRFNRKVKPRYYQCGEYGSKSNRPHYHMILFNVDVEHLVSSHDATQIRLGYLPLNGVHQFECLDWPHGHITIGEVTEASIGYTLKYICKTSRIPMFANDDRVPEFSSMSKGIGSNYLSQDMISWHKNDLVHRYYTPLLDGKKIALPKYYKDKLYSPEEKIKISTFLQEEMLKTLPTLEEKVDKMLITKEKRAIDLSHQTETRLKQQRLKETF